MSRGQIPWLKQFQAATWITGKAAALSQPLPRVGQFAELAADADSPGGSGAALQATADDSPGLRLVVGNVAESAPSCADAAISYVHYLIVQDVGAGRCGRPGSGLVPGRELPA
jgi:hypothetical protein